MPSARHVALITGGARGIGKAIARRLLGAGWAVAIADCAADAGRATAEALASPDAVIFIPADVSLEADVRRMVAETTAAFGGLDLLVNNAGIGIGKPISELSLDEWQRVIGTNLTGAFLGAKYAAPALAARHGSIINIASTRALMSEAHTEAYSAAKGGLVALTHALAVSLGPAVRVNGISPGWIDTSGHPEQLTPADHAQHPAGRVGTPDDVAALVAYLASPDAGFITGQNFVIDGGMTRKMIYV